jgi:periplasmic mercuric ion binding protein
MKSTVAVLMTALALAGSLSAAETTVKLTKVHLCCDGCVAGVQKAVGTVAGVTAAVEKGAGAVALTGPDQETVQKAADALVEAGYFGKSADAEVKLKSDTGAKGEKVESLKIEGVHLCCGKCVKAVDEALKKVPGVKSHTAEKGAKTFEVTGEFNDKDVFAALQKAGLTGKVAK